MATIKKEIINDKPRHFIVGFIIKKGDKYLLFEKNYYPFGYACSCGHIDIGETVDQALARELKEETGLRVESSNLLFNEIISLTPCRYDGTYDHMTSIFEVKTTGKLKVDDGEFKSYGWFTKSEMNKLSFEPMWELVFKKLDIL